jgi:dTDP-glucose 4,6-dehydratase
MTRVLLTGAGGFVGSHVLRHLLAHTDWKLVCPVTFRHRGLSDRIRLAMEDMPEAAQRVDVVRTELAAPISDVTAERWGEIDYVFNVASESHVDRSIEQPAQFIMNNVALMVNLLDWARAAKPKLFLQVSTDEVYGPAERGKAHREWSDLHLPSNPYAASKAAQEDIVFAYWRTYGVPLVITNTMNIIGETQDSEKFVPMVIKRVLAGEQVSIHAAPDGTIGSRFYLHARNQADGLLFVTRYFEAHPYPKYPECKTPPRFHIVGEREVTNLEMAQLIAKAIREISGKNLTLHYYLESFHHSRPGHDLRYALDGMLMAELGWKPPVPLEESLRKTVAWTLARSEWLR